MRVQINDKTLIINVDLMKKSFASDKKIKKQIFNVLQLILIHWLVIYLLIYSNDLKLLEKPATFVQFRW